MSIFKKIKYKMAMFKRIGTFSQAMRNGMSEEEAAKYMNELYPPSKEQLEYEQIIKEKTN